MSFFVVVLLLASGFPVQPAAAQLPGSDCHVIAGGSIQAAIDAAAPGSRIVVCDGIYPESLTISKDGLTLEGKPGAILDGSLLVGTRYGVRVLGGVNGFTFTGFEVRAYDDPLSEEDTSSGVVAFGASRNVRIANNYVHDNAWTGVAFGRDGTDTWTIEGNTFAKNGFAHVLAHDAKRTTIERNYFGAVPHAVVLGYAQKALVSQNEIAGGGAGAVVILPALDLGAWSYLVELRNNTITGNWTHGVWAVALQRSTILSNSLAVAGSAITLGGDAEQVVLHDNLGAPVFESKDVRAALVAIQAASSGSEPQSGEVREKPCAWWSCWWLGVARFFERLVPSASAQVSLEVPPPCELLVPGWSCEETLSNLLDELLFRAANPGASPASADDYAKLEACRVFADQFNTSSGRVGWSREAREGFKTR